ncbi:MAG TPA: hypothetical protein VMR73_01900 [Candidatus Paceibacterota bacterium]|nr:hypothetical protein [Candidatus Paceibacterota bacterium]
MHKPSDSSEPDFGLANRQGDGHENDGEVEKSTTPAKRMPKQKYRNHRQKQAWRVRQFSFTR